MYGQGGVLAFGRVITRQHLVSLLPLPASVGHDQCWTVV